MKAIETDKGFFLVFERGDDFIPTLVNFCDQSEIHSAVFRAIGSIEQFEIGYYNLSERQYIFRSEPGIWEVASMTGNVGQIDHKPAVHVHAVVSSCDDSLTTIGGHLKSAVVALTLEVFLAPLDQPLVREFDKETGLDLISI